MPTYEYRCARCEHGFERVQRISDPPLKTCPKCRGRVRRVICAGAGLLFKGSGFYITDYRSDSYRKAAKADVPAAPAAKADAPSAPAAGDKVKPAPSAASATKPAPTGKK